MADDRGSTAAVSVRRTDRKDTNGTGPTDGTDPLNGTDPADCTGPLEDRASSVAETAPSTDAPAAPTGIAAIIARIFALKPVRVFFHYLSKTGPLLASGLAFQATFATFAGLWVGFSIIGLVLANDAELRNSLVDTISAAVPGLIDDGGGSGAVNPDDLLNAGIFGWTGAIALVGLLGTALNFLASARDAVRRIFDIDPLVANPVLLKLKDFGLALCFGVALIVSTVLSTSSTSLIGSAFDLLGIGSDSPFATVLGSAMGLAVVLALDTVVLAGMYRVLSKVPIPRRRLFAGALIGAVGLGVLKFLGNMILGGTGSNPLLASFAIIIGILIFFNLACQIVLISAAWIAVGMSDAGIHADPVAAEAARLERERIAELERIAKQAREPRGLRKLFRRRSNGPDATSVNGAANDSAAKDSAANDSGTEAGDGGRT